MSLRGDRVLGILAAAALRLILALFYLIVSLLASIIVARRLPPLDYGVYSIAARRLSGLVRTLLNLASYWYKRRASKKDIAEYISSTLVLTPLLYTLALALLLYSRAPLHLALLYALHATLGGYTLSLLTVYVAYRYVRSEALRVAYKLVYSLGVLALVYVARLSSPGVVAAQVVASLATLLVIARESGLARPSFEWLSWKRLRVPLLNTVAGLMVGLDIVVASSIMGPRLIAVYSVATVAPMIVVELSSQAFSHSLPYLVATGDKRSVLRGYKVMMLLAAPLWGYMAARPLLTLSVLNPVYAEEARGYLVVSALLLAPLVLAAIYASLYASGAGREVEESERLRRYQEMMLGVQIARLASIPVVLSLYSDKVLAFIAVQIAVHIMSVIVGVLAERSTAALFVHVFYAMLASMISMVIASTLGDWVAHRFIDAVISLVEGVPILVPIYLAIVVLDPDARLVVRRLFQRALSLVSGGL